jgi:WD40 repeat protein
VLVGHSDAVTAVAVSVTNKSQVISGSKDCNLIVWDLHTGEEIHTLAGHLGPVTCVKVSADGKVDKTSGLARWWWSCEQFRLTSTSSPAAGFTSSRVANKNLAHLCHA